MSEYPATESPSRCPTHPGVVIRKQILPTMGITVTALAKAFGVSRQQLHKLIREDNPEAVSSAMAVRLGAFFGNSAEFWTNMQAAHDNWHARKTVDTAPIVKAREQFDRTAAA